MNKSRFSGERIAYALRQPRPGRRHRGEVLSPSRERRQGNRDLGNFDSIRDHPSDHEKESPEKPL